MERKFKNQCSLQHLDWKENVNLVRYEISTNLKLGILADFMWTRLCIPSPSADFSKSEKVRRTNQINTISGAMAMYIWKAKVDCFLFKSMRERRTRISTNWNFFNSNDQRLGLKDGHWWLDKCENWIRLFNLLRYCSQELGRQVLNPSKKQLGTTTELNKQHVWRCTCSWIARCKIWFIRNFIQRDFQRLL